MIHKIFFLLLLCPSGVISQLKPELEIDLMFGTYFGMHAERKFVPRVRTWKLKENLLEYHIDTYTKRYTDSLQLTREEIKKIVLFIEEKKLAQAVDKELKAPYLSKHGYDEIIKGSFCLNNNVTEIHIKANNGSGLMEKDTQAKSINELEQLLYQIVESHE